MAPTAGRRQRDTSNVSIMESTSRERAAIESFVAAWLQDDETEIVHLEKVAREPSFGSHHDVWDVHLSDARLWVITEPMFAYDQRHIRSMDAAITFHVGLSHRVLFNRRLPDGQPAVLDALATVRRRLEQTEEALNAAVEADDLQAVGARAREALLGVARLMQADLGSDEEAPQLGNFVAWSERACAAWLPGKRLAHLRRSLRNATVDAWQCVNWLTHAQRATRADAMMCTSATQHAVSLAELAMCAPRTSDPAQCGRCGSRRLAREYQWDDEELQFTLICDSCGWSSGEAQPETWRAGEPLRDPADSECTTLEGFGETMTPAEALRRSDAAREFDLARPDQHSLAGTDEEEWANIFAVDSPGGGITDVHRLLYWAHKGVTEPGIALPDTCGDDRCVNPDHVHPTPLDDPEEGWQRALVEVITPTDGGLRVQLSSRRSGRLLVDLDPKAQESLHMSDPSMWLERHVLIAHQARGRIEILPVADAGRPGRTWPVAASVLNVGES